MGQVNMRVCQKEFANKLLVKYIQFKAKMWLECVCVRACVHVRRLQVKHM